MFMESNPRLFKAIEHKTWVEDTLRHKLKANDIDQDAKKVRRLKELETLEAAGVLPRKKQHANLLKSVQRKDIQRAALRNKLEELEKTAALKRTDRMREVEKRKEEVLEKRQAERIKQCHTCYRHLLVYEFCCGRAGGPIVSPGKGLVTPAKRKQRHSWGSHLKQNKTMPNVAYAYNYTHNTKALSSKSLSPQSKPSTPSLPTPSQPSKPKINTKPTTTSPGQLSRGPSGRGALKRSPSQQSAGNRDSKQWNFSTQKEDGYSDDF